MTLLEQLEKITGRAIPVYFPSQIAELDGTTVRETMRTVERYSRVVNIRSVIRGDVKPIGPLVIFVADCRDGFLIQLREGIKET